MTTSEPRRPNADNPSAAIDWPAALAAHDRWLRTVVAARLGEPQAIDEVMQEIAMAVVALEVYAITALVPMRRHEPPVINATITAGSLTAMVFGLHMMLTLVAVALVLILGRWLDFRRRWHLAAMPMLIVGTITVVGLRGGAAAAAGEHIAAPHRHRVG